MVLIIIVTYNASKWIEQCLNSINFDKYHVFIVDNASQDDTIDIIKSKYKNVILYCSNENLGFGKANNIGFKYALDKNIYDYVFLLNQDAWLLHDTIDNLVEAHKKHRNYFVLSPLQYNTNNKGLETLFAEYMKKGEKKEDIINVSFVNAAMWLLPLSCIKIIGGFDPIFPHYGEDNDFVNRVLYKGFGVGIVKKSVGYHERDMDNQKHKHMNVLRQKICYIGILKDINYNILRQVLFLCYITLKKSVKSFLLFQWYNLIGYNTAFFSSLKMMKEIVKHRKISKEKKSFLS